MNMQNFAQQEYMYNTNTYNGPALNDKTLKVSISVQTCFVEYNLIRSYLNLMDSGII